MGSIYFTLRIEADNINMTQTPCASVSPYSIWSYLKALCLNLNKGLESADPFFSPYVKPERFAVIQHDLIVHPGCRNCTTFRSEVKKKSEQTIDHKVLDANIPTEILGSGKFTIILNLTEQGVDYRSLKNEIAKNAKIMKFIGGVTAYAEVSGPYVEDSKDELIRYISTESPYGMFYEHNPDRLDQNLDVDTVMEPGELLSWRTVPVWDRGKKGQQVNEYPTGFHFASLIGYQLIEKPRFRSGTRDENRRHAFAEPVYSIINRVPLPRITRSRESLGASKIWWTRCFDEASSTIYVTNVNQ